MSKFAAAIALTVTVFSMSAHAAGVIDEQMVVPAHGWHLQGFRTTRPMAVNLGVEGIRDTGKGFDVYLMQEAEYPAFQHAMRGERRCAAGQSRDCPRWEFRHFPDFHALKVNAINPKADLAAGEYAVVVVNRYNLLRDLTVRVRVDATPLQKDPPLKMIVKALLEAEAK